MKLKAITKKLMIMITIIKKVLEIILKVCIMKVDEKGGINYDKMDL